MSGGQPPAAHDTLRWSLQQGMGNTAQLCGAWNGTLQLQDCALSRWGICQRDERHIPSPVKCPPNWHWVEDSCIQVLPHPATLQSAVSMCKHRSATLLQPGIAPGVVEWVRDVALAPSALDAAPRIWTSLAKLASGFTSVHGSGFPAAPWSSPPGPNDSAVAIHSTGAGLALLPLKANATTTAWPACFRPAVPQGLHEALCPPGWWQIDGSCMLDLRVASFSPLEAESVCLGLGATEAEHVGSRALTSPLGRDAFLAGFVHQHASWICAQPLSACHPQAFFFNGHCMGLSSAAVEARHAATNCGGSSWLSWPSTPGWKEALVSGLASPGNHLVVAGFSAAMLAGSMHPLAFDDARSALPWTVGDATQGPMALASFAGASFPSDPPFWTSATSVASSVSLCASSPALDSASCPTGWSAAGPLCLRLTPELQASGSAFRGASVCAGMYGQLASLEGLASMQTALALLHNANYPRGLTGIIGQDLPGFASLSGQTAAVSAALTRRAANTSTTCVTIGPSHNASELAEFQLVPCGHTSAAPVAICERRVRSACPFGWVHSSVSGAGGKSSAPDRCYRIYQAPTNHTTSQANCASVYPGLRSTLAEANSVWEFHVLAGFMGPGTAWLAVAPSLRSVYSVPALTDPYTCQVGIVRHDGGNVSVATRNCSDLHRYVCEMELPGGARRAATLPAAVLRGPRRAMWTKPKAKPAHGPTPTPVLAVSPSASPSATGSATASASASGSAEPFAPPLASSTPSPSATPTTSGSSSPEWYSPLPTPSNLLREVSASATLSPSPTPCGTETETPLPLCSETPTVTGSSHASCQRTGSASHAASSTAEASPSAIPTVG